MRKNRKIVALITSIILVLVMLAGCSSQNASTGSSANATQVVQATPEVTPSSAVEVASSEAQQPASQESTLQETASSAEAVADNPNFIDGIDFTEYFAGNKPLKYYFLNELHYDSLRWVVTDDEHSKIAIYKDGDSIKLSAEKETWWYLYSNKKIVEYYVLSSTSENMYTCWVVDGRKGYYADINFYAGNICNDYEVKIRFDYEDGTQEEITVYVTAD